ARRGHVVRTLDTLVTGARPIVATRPHYAEDLQDALIAAVARDRGVRPEQVGRVPLNLKSAAERARQEQDRPPQPAQPSHREQLEDSAAKVIAAQYRVPIESVMVNGRRYGDV